MEKIIEIVTRYFRDRKGVIAVFLFGSYAANGAQPFSDIDIGVVAEHESIDRIKSEFGQYMIDLSRVSRKDIHLVMLNLAPESLLSQVFNKGKCLIVNNRRGLSEFKMNAFVKIIDFNYHQKRMQTGFIERLMGA